jgi:ATP/ADP translocase
MNTRTLNLLNIRPSEAPYVFRLLTVQLFIGIAHSIVNIVAFTLFLKDLSIQVLPYAYLAIAVTLVLLNIGYEKLEHKLSSLVLLQYIIGISAAILAFILAGFSFGNIHAFVFILLVWSSLFYMVTGYAYWGLVSQLFNVRESRRVFSVVGAGDIPAKLIGYVIAPMLIPWVGLVNLIWLAIFSLLVAFFYYNHIIKNHQWDVADHPQHHRHHVHAKSKLGFIQTYFQSELIFAISLLAILSYNVFNFIDFTFLAHVKERYDDVASLAIFIAAFFAIGRFMALIMKLIFSSRVIDKLGIIACLFITPAVLFVFSLVFLFIDEGFDYTLFLFGAMVLVTEVLRSTIQEPVFFILFQPLKERLRLKGHIISKGYMLPPSFLIVGISLIIMHKVSGEISILSTDRILILNLIVWVAVIFYVRKTYLKTLHESIRKGVYNADELYIQDESTTKVLLQKVEKGKLSEQIYALSLLQNAAYPEISSLLVRALESPHHELRLYALEQLSGMKPFPIEPVNQLLAIEQNEEVQAKALQLLCKFDSKFLNRMAEDLSSLSLPFKKAVIPGLMNQHEFEHLVMAGNELNALIASQDPNERLLAMDIIGELKNVKFTEAIAALINDPVPAVKRQALLTACKMQQRKLLPQIIDMLASPKERFMALQALQQYGEQIYTDYKGLDTVRQQIFLPDLIRLSLKIKSPAGSEFLHTYLHDETLGDAAIHALWLQGYEATDKKPVFENLLHERLQMAKEKMYKAFDLRNEGKMSLVASALKSEAYDDLMTALKICAILHPEPGVHRMVELLEQKESNKIYNGMEMIEILLPSKISREINFLIDHLMHPETIHEGHSAGSTDRLMHEIVFSQPEKFNAWTKSICMYTSWKARDQEFLRKLTTTSTRGSLILQETKEYVLTAIT